MLSDSNVIGFCSIDNDFPEGLQNATLFFAQILLSGLNFDNFIT
jgi:hypothetical protein